ncbi:MAG: hypothetical protein EXQ69_06890 [Acidimicrobiia bacterium]|nr:hypothetical protein [Acidimicrobiia bacterium]
MAPRIVIIGGGSYQWVPKLLVDLANTPSLNEAEIVIEDLDLVAAHRMVTLVEHVAGLRDLPLKARATNNQHDALDGADYVVVSISTGGFESMRHDLEIPARYGIHQSVGDTVGPGGISRSLRNIPVLVGIARDMEQCCPHAWMLNLTNPMTALCRAVARETSITTIGLCHEVTLTRFVLSLLFDADFRDVHLEITGVNHLPIITSFRIGDEDGFELLRDLLENEGLRGLEPIAFAMPDEMEYTKTSPGDVWTRGDLLAVNRLKLELFSRFGVLPGAGDSHIAEFFPGFLTEESGRGKKWGVPITTIADRQRDQVKHIADFESMLAATEVSVMPSGELVAALIDSRLRDKPRDFPLNLPNIGQCPDLPVDVVVESMCIVDATGVRGRDVAVAPPAIAEHLRRVSASQELTVDAGISGDRDLVVAAMLADPLAGRIDYDLLERMSDEMLSATAKWLPQFI